MPSAAAKAIAPRVTMLAVPEGLVDIQPLVRARPDPMIASFGAGRYRVIRVIGRGGMGTVYEVNDAERDSRVALKTVSRADAQRIGQLKREFRAAAELRHENLVELYDLIVEPGECFFTMQLIDGFDLRRWVQGSSAVDELSSAETALAQTHSQAPSTPQPSGPLAQARQAPRALAFHESRLRTALVGLADGLAFLHERGIVHRDVKSSNAVVSRDGVIKLLDFGLAFDWRDAVAPRRSSTPIVGTVAYMAPEYLHGQRVSPAIDLYALGIVGFELVTGAPPFSGTFYEIVSAHVETPPPRARDINPAVPPELDALIAALLAKDPAARPSAEQVRGLVTGSDGDGDVAARRPTRLQPRFVGRDAELAALLSALARVRSGERALVLVGGPAGAGKTTLIDELVYQQPLRSTAVWRGRCYEREAIPYRAFDAIVESLVADLSAEDQELPLSSPALAGALVRVFPAFAAVWRGELGTPAADPDVERERAFTALGEVFSERARGRISLVALDDLQWADAGSLALIAFLRRAAPPGLLVVATYRDDDLEPGGPLALLIQQAAAAGATALVLAPLDGGEIAALVRSVVPEVSDAALAAIGSHAAGNPYVAEALASEIVADGSLAASVDPDAIDRRRLDRLDGVERAVAEAISAAGEPVPFGLLREVTELAPARLQSALHALQVERIVRAAPVIAGPVTYGVYHYRVRDAAYRALAPARKRDLHRGFAVAWEAAALRDTGAAPPERLALHWERAGEPGRAAAHAVRAAAEAMAKLAFAHAVVWYRRALELAGADELADAATSRSVCPDAGQALDAVRVRGHLAEAEILAGDFAAASRSCRALADACAGLPRERWLLRAAEAEIKLGELSAGIALIDAILASRGLSLGKARLRSLLGGLGVGARAIAFDYLPRLGPAGRRDLDDEAFLADVYRVVASFLSTPQPIESWEFVVRSIELARRRGDRAGEACALAQMSGYLDSGSLGRFRGWFLPRARDLAERSGEPYAQVVIAAADTLAAISRGDWADMRVAAERGESICAELGLGRSWEASFLRTYHGLGEQYAGEIDRSLELFAAMLDGRTPDLFTRAMVGSFYGRSLVLAGRLDEAGAQAAALRRDPAAGHGAPQMYRSVLDAELALANGRWAEALRITEAMAAAARAGWMSLLPAVQALRDQLRATAELGLGHDGAPASTRRAHAHAVALLRHGRHSFYEPIGLRLRGLAERALGRDGEAAATFAEAGRVAAVRGGQLERICIDALLGRAPVPAPFRATVHWMTAGAIA